MPFIIISIESLVYTAQDRAIIEPCGVPINDLNVGDFQSTDTCQVFLCLKKNGIISIHATIQCLHYIVTWLLKMPFYYYATGTRVMDVFLLSIKTEMNEIIPSR